jgi:GT2 family glycosyltransferase
MSPVRIAVLLTSHNRRVKTLGCLASLYEQRGLGEDFTVDVFLVDAGSTDGTREEVHVLHPAVRLIEAEPDVYWGSGMRRAACEAGTDGYEHHLWLNDDVTLNVDAFARLLATEAEHPGRVVVGQLVDDQGRPSYGGFLRGRLPLKFIPVGVRPATAVCDTLNGNVVLIPSRVVELIGPVDDRFPHAMGDIDFGLRARRRGVDLVQASGIVATCNKNVPVRQDPSHRAWKRARDVASVKRLPPRAWWTFCRRHGGWLALGYFVKPYLGALRNRS